MNKIEIPQEIITALNGNQNKIAIISKLLEKKGQFVQLKIRRPLNLLAKYKNKGIIGWKYTEMQVRAGVEYSKLTKVLEERGANSKSEPLEGREWIAFPYVLRTTSANPKVLFRFYTVNNNNKPKVKYIIDNFEVQKEDLENFCPASEYKDKGDKICFDLSIDSIEEVK